MNILCSSSSSRRWLTLTYIPYREFLLCSVDGSRSFLLRLAVTFSRFLDNLNLSLYGFELLILRPQSCTFFRLLKAFDILFIEALARVRSNHENETIRRCICIPGSRCRPYCTMGSGHVWFQCCTCRRPDGSIYVSSL